MGGFGPVERTYHLCRRRKWIRVRERIDNSKVRGANSNRCFLATNCIFATVLANLSEYRKFRTFSIFTICN